VKLEPIWYEYSPYVYAVGGMFSLSNYGSYIAIGSGVLLIGASATILRMRLVYRRNRAEQLEREERALRAARRSRERNTTRMIIHDDDDDLDS
jgi:hypothetical protein